MQKFDKSAAWDDAKRLLSAHSGLIWAVAGVFIFLPQLLLDFVAAPPPVTGTGIGVDAESQLMVAWFMSHAPMILLMGLAALVGTIAIMRLWLARASISVGEALFTGLTLVPTLLVAQLATGIASGMAMVLLIIPGLYLYARFICIGPLAADLKIYNPITLISGSWALTKDRGFSILLYLALVVIAAAIVYILLSSVAMLVLGYIPAVGLTLVKVANGALATVFNVFVIAITTSIYRQLVAIGGEALYRE